MKTKILVLTGIGPILVQELSETSDAYVVINPMEIVPVDESNISFRPVLDYMCDDDAKYTIYKSSVLIDTVPNSGLGNAYTQAVQPQDQPKIFMPEEKKLIL